MSHLEETSLQTPKYDPQDMPQETTTPKSPFKSLSVLESDDWLKIASLNVKIGNFRGQLTVEAPSFEKIETNFIYYKINASSNSFIIVAQTNAMSKNAVVGTINKNAYKEQIPIELHEELLQYQDEVADQQKSFETAQRAMLKAGKVEDGDVLNIFNSVVAAGAMLGQAAAVVGERTEEFTRAQRALSQKQEEVAQIFVDLAEDYYSTTPVSSTIRPNHGRTQTAEAHQSSLPRRRSYSRSRSRSRSQRSTRSSYSDSRGMYERQRERDQDMMHQTTRANRSRPRRGRSASNTRTPRPTKRTSRLYAWRSAMTVNRRQNRVCTNALTSDLEGFGVLSNGMTTLSAGLEEGFGALSRGMQAMERGLGSVTSMATTHSNNASETSRQTHDFISRLLDEEESA